MRAISAYILLNPLEGAEQSGSSRGYEKPRKPVWREGGHHQDERGTEGAVPSVGSWAEEGKQVSVFVLDDGGLGSRGGPPVLGVVAGTLGISTPADAPPPAGVPGASFSPAMLGRGAGAAKYAGGAAAVDFFLHTRRCGLACIGDTRKSAVMKATYRRILTET